MRFLASLVLPVAFAVAACSAPTEDDLGDETDDALKVPKKAVNQESRDEKLDEALVAIRNAARAHQLSNGWLLAGIAKVETQLTHCYDYATFAACPGLGVGAQGKAAPLISKDCDGGPIVAGASDKGGCSQGGLGLFQLDAGTQAKTVDVWKDKGFDILALRGNADAAAHLLLGKIASAPRVSVEDPKAWLRSIKAPNRNDKDYEAYLGILANGYNGWDWDQPGWKKQKTKYHEGVVAVLALRDAAWWK